MADFNCDRQAKNDFTASTTAYLAEQGNPYRFDYYEQSVSGDLVPYGDADASTTSHIDIYMDYITSAYTKRYAVEIKERIKYTSSAFTQWYYNIPKDRWLQSAKDAGYIPLFVNLYPDGVIDIWNLTKVDTDGVVVVPLKKVEINPDSPRVEQERLLLPSDKAKRIRRVKGKGNDRQKGDN